MTHDQLLAFLIRCVRDRVITERRAAELLLAFDRGELDPADLPEDQEDSNLIPILLLSTSLLIRLLRGLGYSVEQPLVIPASATEGLKEALRLEFQQQARRLAAVLQASGDVNAWQSGMADLIKRNMVENAMVGAGRTLTPEELGMLQPAADEQMAFLARFADRIALDDMLGDPMSEAEIGARSVLYGKAGITAGAVFDEMTANRGTGWVYYYISRDDFSTCSPCLAAEEAGPYLEGQGPYPGDVCLGGGYCRCVRQAVYDVGIALELEGEAAA